MLKKYRKAHHKHKHLKSLTWKKVHGQHEITKCLRRRILRKMNRNPATKLTNKTQRTPTATKLKKTRLKTEL